MTENAIEVRNLVKKYPNVTAVNGISFDVKKGEVFGLLGPNGAGKTTTLEILEGITKPDSGSIRICGMDWAKQGAEIRTKIGVQFQSTTLDENITPREVLSLYGSYYPKSRPVQELLELTQLEAKADAFQETLSGGQRQRLVLGIALIHDPELVFLDEPTTGLDPQARRSLWSVIRELKNEGRTVILTTHYMEEAEVLCDRVAIVDKGQLLEVGTPRELVNSLGIPSVVELSFADELPDASAFEEKMGRPIEKTEDYWAIPVSDPKMDLPKIFECAETLALPFQQVHVRHASLEDVFLQKTGRSLRE